MVQSPESSALDLRDFVRMLGRRKWTVVLVTGIALVAGLLFSLSRTPRYRASAEVLIAPKRSETLFNTANGQLLQDTGRYVATEIRVLTGEAVREIATDELGYKAQITATGSREDNVVTVSAEHEDPAKSAQIANTYATAYIDHRRETAVKDSLKAQSVIQEQVDEKQARLDELDEAVTRAAASQRAAVSADQEVERADLNRQLSLLRSQVDQLQLSAGLNSGEAQLLTAASEPDDPFDPRPVTTGMLALFLGAVLGVGVAFVRELFDDSLRTKEDLERVTRGLPVLSMIPVVPGWRKGRRARVVTMRSPTSMAAEAYRSLRTSIQFLVLDTPVRTLQVTSPSQGEGKTTTVANLCVALANAGQRVVVVDCDLRKSRLHEFFGLATDVGFTSVLLGDVPLSEALQKVAGVERLLVLPAGPHPPNPSELLSGPRAVEVLLALQAHADMVIIDSPPVLPVSDAVALAARVDATLLVANARTTSRRSVLRALELLQQVDAPLIGTVLNATRVEEGYGYGYGYGYGPPEGRPASSSKDTGRHTATRA